MENLPEVPPAQGPYDQLPYEPGPQVCIEAVKYQLMSIQNLTLGYKGLF